MKWVHLGAWRKRTTATTTRGQCSKRPITCSGGKLQRPFGPYAIAFEFALIPYFTQTYAKHEPNVAGGIAMDCERE